MTIEAHSTHETRLYNSRLVRSYLEYLQRHRPDVDTTKLLAAAALDPQQVAEPAHWLTQAEVNRFQQAVVQACGGSIAYAVGRFGAQAQTTGRLRRYLLSFLTPAAIFGAVGRSARHLTRAGWFACEAKGKRQFELRWTVAPGVEESPHQCDNRRGILEAVAELSIGPDAKTDHPECLHEGGACCRYEVRWRRESTAGWRRAAGLIMLATTVASVAGAATTGIGWGWLALALAGSLAAAAHLLTAAHRDRERLLSVIGSQREAATDQLQQANLRYESALMIHEVGQAISTLTEVPPLLKAVGRILTRRLDFRRGAILLVVEGADRVESFTFGLDAAARQRLDDAIEPLDEWDEQSRGGHETKVLDPTAAADGGATTLGVEAGRLKSIFAGELTCVPIRYRPYSRADTPLSGEHQLSVAERSIGEILLESERPLSQTVRGLLSGIASQTAVCVANIRASRDRLGYLTQLAQSKRLAAVGVLAAGVAHEINNPLAFLLGNLQFVKETLEERGGDERELLEATEEALIGASRVRDIVTALKTFARRDDNAQPTPLAVDEVLESAIKLAASQIKHRAQLERSFGTTPPVMGNEGKLCQVFVNLLVNAGQAIPDGAFADNTVYVRTFATAGEVVVEVEDTGTGIPDEMVSRIFDPFFTTKAGTGTGLGLAISHGIIASHGGRLEVESTPGEGTRFRVLLPQAGEDRSDVATIDAPLAPVELPRVRLLVVDDEPSVGTMLRRHLEREHEVVLAATGAEAQQLFSAGERFDVVLCDLVMPGVSGPALFAWTQHHHPELAARFIFTSGGAFTDEAATFVAEMPGTFLHKPVRVDELRRAMAELVT